MPACTSQTKAITDCTTPMFYLSWSELRPIPVCRVWRQTSFDTRPLDKIRSHNKDSKCGGPRDKTNALVGMAEESANVRVLQIDSS